MARPRNLMARLDRLTAQREANRANFHCPCCSHIPLTYEAQKAFEEYCIADLDAALHALKTGEPKQEIQPPEDPSDAYTGTLHCSCCKRIPDPELEQKILDFLDERRAAMGLPDDSGEVAALLAADNGEA